VISLSLWGPGFNPRSVHAGFVEDCHGKRFFSEDHIFCLSAASFHQYSILTNTTQSYKLATSLTKWFKGNNSSLLEII